jgi:hypothetical protein
MLLAHRLAFPEHRLVVAPAPGMLPRLARVVPWPVLDGAVLGGGTLVGWPTYRSSLEELLSLGSELPGFAMGVGVEDPEFLGRDRALVQAIDGSGRRPGDAQEAFERELDRWAEVLGRLRRVTVRGPRSQEILATAGVRAEVVGDPALLLADAAPTAAPGDRLLGINIGRSRAMWGDLETLVSRTAEFAEAMTGRGWRLRFVAVWPEDLPVVLETARRVGREAEVVEGWTGLDVLLDRLRECRAFVGMKLHSAVLASAVHVPSVMLEYQPKCADFQRSVGRGDFLVRTDALDVASLVDRVDELDRGYEGHRAALGAAVGVLRMRLEAEAVTLRGLLTQAASSTVASSPVSRRRSKRAATGGRRVGARP